MMDRRPGRPKAIPQAMVPIVLDLYRSGFGYRATARELAKRHGIVVSYHTVKRLVKAGEPAP